MRKSTIALLAALGVVMLLALALVLVGALTLRSRLQAGDPGEPGGGASALSGRIDHGDADVRLKSFAGRVEPATL